MKLLLFFALLFSVSGCSTLKPPTNAQIVAGQQAATQQVSTRPVNTYIRDAPTVIPKNKPLVFVDGRKYSAVKLRRFNPDRIDSVKIANSNTGISLYGNRGRHGVVVISTKKSGR